MFVSFSINKIAFRYISQNTFYGFLIVGLQNLILPHTTELLSIYK